MICKIEKYIETEAGKQLDVLTDTETGEVQEIVGHHYHLVNTPQGQGLAPISFPIMSTSIEGALEIFEEAKEAYIEAQRKQQEEASRIVTPDGKPAGGGKTLEFPGL